MACANCDPSLRPFPYKLHDDHYTAANWQDAKHYTAYFNGEQVKYTFEALAGNPGYIIRCTDDTVKMCADCYKDVDSEYIYGRVEVKPNA